MFNVKLLENDGVVINDCFDGFLSDNCINYNDGVNNILNLNTLVLERISDVYRIVFDFFNSTCCFVVDGLSINMIIDVIDKRICSNSIFLKYKIVDTGDIYEYGIEW